MFKFLLNPRSLIFLIVYLFSIIWYLSDGFKSFDAIWEPFGSGSSVQKSFQNFLGGTHIFSFEKEDNLSSVKSPIIFYLQRMHLLILKIPHEIKCTP